LNLEERQARARRIIRLKNDDDVKAAIAEISAELTAKAMSTLPDTSDHIEAVYEFRALYRLLSHLDMQTADEVMKPN
jgi:hypothetical protein